MSISGCHDFEGIKSFNRLVAWPQIGTDNQALARQAGVAKALSVFPNDPAAPAWRDYLEKGWRTLIEFGDFDENSSSYNAIGLRAALEIAAETANEDALKTPEFRRVFERYRDLLSPSGSMPEIGDNYFSAELNSDWLMVFESAARLYDDPTYLTAAWKLFWRAVGTNPSLKPPDMLTRSNIAWVNELGPLPGSAEPLKVSTMITPRISPAGEVPDKMILAPDREPGSPYVLVDLYCDGYHAHQNRHGAVLYFESGGIPIFHGMTRHATGAEHSNQVILREQGQPFPNGPRPGPDTWITASFPSRLLGEAADSEDGTRKLDRVTFRLDSTTGRRPEILIDHLRLVGSAGSRVIESFEGPTNGFEIVEESREGGGAARLADTFPDQIFWHLVFDEPIDWKPAEFSALQFDWKFRNAEREDFSFIFRADGIHNGPPDFLNAAPILAGSQRWPSFELMPGCSPMKSSSP